MSKPTVCLQLLDKHSNLKEGSQMREYLKRDVLVHFQLSCVERVFIQDCPRALWEKVSTETYYGRSLVKHFARNGLQTWLTHESLTKKTDLVDIVIEKKPKQKENLQQSVAQKRNFFNKLFSK